jgi:cell division protein FtsL
MQTSTSTTQTRPRERAKTHRCRDTAVGHARSLNSEMRNLHREEQALTEQAAVQQAESSASHIRQ